MSVAHPFEQAPLLHVPGAQLWVPLPLHGPPFPAQVEALVSVAVPAQLAATHWVPAA
jgi:hypothetical protein